MLTLKKVKELVEAPVHTKRVPSPKALLEEGLILKRKEFDYGSHLTVYQSGYVLFSAGKRNTVFHIHDCCGDYAYDAAAGRGDVIKEEYFENCEWHIRALFEGERKMEESQWKCEGAGQSNVCVSYDLMSKMLSTVFFFTCIILITPFVSLYTGGISDIDYYQPLFATLLCLAEYVYCTSLTYNNMIMAAGHIKQTQWISVTEAIINIVLSLILVKWIGIIGVALGTLIAFAFNTVANIVYMKKYIFDMSLGWIIKVYLANLVAGVLAMCLFGNIVNAHITGFISFFIWAAVVFAGVCLIDVVLNYFFFKNETKTVLYKIGKKFAR